MQESKRERWPQDTFGRTVLAAERIGGGPCPLAKEWKKEREAQAWGSLVRKGKEDHWRELHI